MGTNTWKRTGAMALGIGIGLGLPARVARAGVAVEEARVTADDGALLDHFGESVDLSGDLAVCGAAQPGRGTGAAYVYAQGVTGWSQQAKLLLNDAAFADSFGASVGIDGTTIVVGTPRDGISGPEGGSASIFVQQGTSWVESTKLTSPQTLPNDFLGSAVAIDGNTVVLGAPGADNLDGAVYVFVNDGGNWNDQQARLVSSDGGQARFGVDVSISGDTLLIGTLRGEAAYVFVRDGTRWSQQARLTAFDGLGVDLFGSAVSVWGDTAVVGAHAQSMDTGAAYVFVRSGTTWSQQAKLTASDAFMGQVFGLSVSVSGDSLLVGAPHDDQAGPGAGSAYLFLRTGEVWRETAKLIGSDTDAPDEFGSDVALADGMGIFGAPFANTPSADLAGAAYVFEVADDVVPFCFGTSPAPCACDNHGEPGNGCGNGRHPGGANLAASVPGLPSVHDDEVLLVATNLPPFTWCLFMQSKAAAAQAHGTPFGDGALCLGGGVRRLGIKPTFLGTVSYPGFLDRSLSDAGDVPRDGGPVAYQALYRTSSWFDVCGTSGAGFNTTNGLRIDWMP